MELRNTLITLAALVLFIGIITPVAAQEAEIESEGELTIDLLGNTSQSSEVTVVVTDNGSAVANATVEVNEEEAGRTGSNGELAIQVPDTNELEIEAEKGELEGSLEVEIETGDDEENETEYEENETEEDYNETRREHREELRERREEFREETRERKEELEEHAEEARFSARMMTAIKAVEAVADIAPDNDTERRLDRALDILKGVQEDTNTTIPGADNRTDDDPEEPENETVESRDTGPGQRGPGERGPPENENRPGFVNRMLSGLFN